MEGSYTEKWIEIFLIINGASNISCEINCFHPVEELILCLELAGTAWFSQCLVCVFAVEGAGRARLGGGGGRG